MSAAAEASRLRCHEVEEESWWGKAERELNDGDGVDEFRMVHDARAVKLVHAAKNMYGGFKHTSIGQ